MTATAGSDVVQSGRQFWMTFSNICDRISAITRRISTVNVQQPIKRTKQSVFLDATVFRHTPLPPNAAVLFVDVAIQPEVHLIAKQNSLMKIRKIEAKSHFGPIRRIYAFA
ncbi:hypothetical protein TNCV_2382611 [Trichonephila clavipes]|nr:hypothetical protein TNCV_2382611 [Trichonephila clavipes]